MDQQNKGEVIAAVADADLCIEPDCEQIDDLDELAIDELLQNGDLSSEGFMQSLTKKAYLENKKHPDIEKRVAYWRDEARLIQIADSSSKKFFSELFGKEHCGDTLVEMLAEDLAIQSEVLSAYRKAQTSLRLEIIQKVREENKLKEEAAVAAQAETECRVAQEKKEARLAKTMARRAIQLFPVISEAEIKQKTQGRTREAGGR